MEQKKERENSRQVHPSAMAGNDTNLQLSADIYNNVNKEVEADLTESGGDDDVLSNILPAPENPTVDVNSIYEPPIYGLPQRATLWGEYMPEEFLGLPMTNEWVYSLLYNGITIGASSAATLAVVLALAATPARRYLLGHDIR